MQSAQRLALAGKGYVDRLFCQTECQFLFFQRLKALLDSCFQRLTDFVCDLADDRALFGRELAHLFEDRGQLTFFPEVTDTDVVQFFGVDEVFQFAQPILFDLFQLFSNGHWLTHSFQRRILPHRLFLQGKGNKKALVP